MHKIKNLLKVIKLHSPFITISVKKNERAIEIPALIGLGKIYFGLWFQSIFSENISDSQRQKTTVYLRMGINYNQKAVEIAQRVRDYHSLGKALNNLGSIYLVTSENDKSFTYFRAALLVLKDVQDPTAEGVSWYTLGGLMKLKGQPETTISFYKKSVERFESIRKNLRVNPESITPEAYSSYTQSVAYIYRDLADILLKQDRTLEALQVLDLLKVNDLQDFLKDFKGNDRTAKGIELFPQEQAILTAFNNSSTDLNEFLKSSTIKIQTQYLKANAANQNLQLNTYSDLQTRIKKLGKNIALFYPLILDDRLELVVLTNDRPPIRKPVAISKDQLKTDIETFRKQLQNRDPLIKKTAQNLYQKIIQPIESEFKAAKVDTIVYAPDDIMRYVPLAALHDGKQWLAENYQINYLTALALTPLEPDKNTTPRVLAAALTEPKTINLFGQPLNFSALQFTQPEIENLAKTIPNTTQLLNPTFNRQNLTTGIPNHTILHLATHGYFVPNSPDQSIILLGDGTTLNLREIEQQWKLPNTSLVVLSACETAIGGKLGNGIEILGFGYQMQRIGSRASISSLWTIDDGGTQGFMNTFYTEIKQRKTIAAAVQNTQKAFINGQITTTSLRAQLRANAKPDIPDGIPTDLTHPYYWAPFILIGNGL